MSTFPGSPRILKGSLVLIDPYTSTVQRIISLQYNPETLTRTLQVQSIGEGSGDRSEALRLTGPPLETIKLDAEIDAADQLDFSQENAANNEDNQTIIEVGIQAQLEALETILYPHSSQLQENNRLAQSGTLEIAPMEAPLALFVWSKKRILPVRITEFSVTEEAFDTELNPIRAKVSLGMRVLNVNDLGFAHKGGSLFMVYQQAKEQLSAKSKNVTLKERGIGEIL